MSRRERESTHSAMTSDPSSGTFRAHRKVANQMSLKILSWNIHDAASIEGKKVEDNSFLSVITQADIFCLQETKEEVKIPNYRCFNSMRTDSRSGGVCLGIKTELIGLLKPLEANAYSNDFQAFMLTRDSIGTEQDIVIINIYDSPAASSYKMKRVAAGDSATTLSKLEAFCSNLPINHILFIAGDMNARTGGSATYSENNEAVIQQLADGNFSKNDNSPERNSKDRVTNERGKQLVEFGCEWNLKILNGATVGDHLGDWTCYRYNGNSVVDYIMVSHDFQDKVSYLKVLDLT